VHLLAHKGVAARPARVLFAALGFVRAAVSRSADRNRRGRAEIGRRGHGGNLASVEDERAGARCPRTFRGNEGRDRHRRSKYVLDDGAHRGVQSTRRVHLQYHELCLLALRARKRPVHEIRRCRPDRALERNEQHFAGRRYRRRNPPCQ
jgi:hypothetical protein